MTNQAPEIRATTVGSYSPIDWLAALPSEQAVLDATAVVVATQRRAGIGVIDIKVNHIESPDEVARRIEKPAAMNLGEIERLRAAQGDRVVACCSARFSHYPSSNAARKFLRSGKLGAIRAIACRAVVPPRKPAPPNPPPWRLSRKLNGGGILVNWGSYDLDFLFSLLDFKLQPVHALARTWQVPPPSAAYAAPGSDAETHVNALVTFQDGSVFDYERAEFGAIPGEQRWQICGENGALSLRLLPGRDDRLVWWKPDPAQGVREETLWEGDQSSIGHTALVDANFVAAIRGEAEPFTCLRKSALVQRVTDAIYASADAGRPTTIEPAR